MKKSPPRSGMNRRQFIAAASAAVAMPTFIPASALGRDNNVPPSERITMGIVGWGMMGPGNTKNFLEQKDCQVVAACDLDDHHLKSAVNTINGHYQNEDCKKYRDYREMMARKDIDAVMIAVPDHWHALVAVEAANNKKDIYGEKPLAKTIVEQQAIVHAVKKNRRIWQTGSWQRSQGNFHKAAEIVRNGLIGKVTHCEVGLPEGHHDFAGTEPALLKKFATLPNKIDNPARVVPGTPEWNLAVTEPPPELDYQTWIGPSHDEPYIQARVHMNWRWNYNTGGGQLMDWVGHHVDIAHWGMDFDNSGPSEIEGHGDFPPPAAIWNTCTKYHIDLQYPKGITMVIAGGYKDIKGGTKWIGTDGWVYVNRGEFDASNADWKDMKQLPEEMRKVKLYRSENHQRNFLDCVKSRKPTITPAETAHHSAIPGHLGLISMVVGRKLRWDVAHERILNDREATNLMGREYRSPWKLDYGG